MPHQSTGQLAQKMPLITNKSARREKWSLPNKKEPPSMGPRHHQ